MKPRIAVITFPGSNGDTDNLRALWRCGLDAFVFRWNDSKEKLEGVDGYFIGAGFAYEDRGRAGMVAGRDPIFQHLHAEAAKGKVVVGNCNGAQVLVESELIPLGAGLRMSLAKNACQTEEGIVSPGFLNQWIWMTPICPKDRCAISNFDALLHVPIAHGEGRFTTKDPAVIEELKRNNQVALAYCDAGGNVHDQLPYCPNGAMFGAAAICNPAGNVVGCMPHPERTENGDPYFRSMLRWIERKVTTGKSIPTTEDELAALTVPERSPKDVEIYIDTVITNNEERTVEQAARRVLPILRLKQWRYIAPKTKDAAAILTHFSHFNPNKEVAYVRRSGTFFRWNSDSKREEQTAHPPLQGGIAFLRRDEPDTGAMAFGQGSETGICYHCMNADDSSLQNRKLLEIFANPHASTLERLAA